MEKYNITIDGRSLTVSPGTTILEAAQNAGITIPTLCYQPNVANYGGCGLCVVSVKGARGLQRSCSVMVQPDMEIETDNREIQRARTLALELLFSDHDGDCLAPCIQACPAHTHCQGYVGLIADGEYKKANALIKDKLPLPASIGRVCPHPCEGACRRRYVEEPVAIRELKRFVADWDLKQAESYLPRRKPLTGKSIAIIGGGPGGLTVGYYLAQMGHSPEIFEAMPAAGGMLRYGIPSYRLPKDILDKEINLIQKMGVTFHYNTKIGKDISFGKLKQDYDAVYIGIGAWESKSLGCKGENLPQVYGGIDFLESVACGNPLPVGRRVAVVGGGNTAMDACRTALRSGAEEVTVVYRRTRNEMPAEAEEIDEAIEEGIRFAYLSAPLEVLSEDDKVVGLRLQKMELGEADSFGRRRPVPVEGAIEDIEVDTIIAAIGQNVATDGIPVDVTSRGTIKADTSTYSTSQQGVFAGGDCINDGPGIAIAAIGHGNEAATIIDCYLKGDIVPYREPFLVHKDEVTVAEELKALPKAERCKTSVLPPSERKSSFKEIADTLSEEAARKEASRCLECGCNDYGECKLIKYGQEYPVEPQRYGNRKRHRNPGTAMPDVEYNPDKCILCGLCVRHSQENGKGTLGLINRGFDTIIQPDFMLLNPDDVKQELLECADLCPTGALMKKSPHGKKVHPCLLKKS